MDEQLFDELLLYATESYGSDEKPTFKPGTDLGEGTPSKEELDYRAELLLLLGVFFARVTENLQNKHPNSTKITRIENLGKEWTYTAGQTVERQLNKLFQLGVKDMNLQLQATGYAPQAKTGNMKYYTLVQQQTQNLEFISREVINKLSQQLRIQDIEKQFQVPQNGMTKPQPNNVFNVAKRRTDAMGAYGANVSFVTGQQAAAQEWVGEIQLDWVTTHDKRVCALCREYEQMSPYPVNKIPIIPHKYCRCRLRIHKGTNVRGIDMGNPLIPLAILNELEKEEQP